jgi:hypothetical protein
MRPKMSADLHNKYLLLFYDFIRTHININTVFAKNYYNKITSIHSLRCGMYTVPGKQSARWKSLRQGERKCTDPNDHRNSLTNSFFLKSGKVALKTKNCHKLYCGFKTKTRKARDGCISQKSFQSSLTCFMFTDAESKRQFLFHIQSTEHRDIFL